MLPSVTAAAAALFTLRRRKKKRAAAIRARPQLQWADEIDNSPEPWQPSVRYRYVDERTSFRPTDEQLTPDEGDADAVALPMKETPLRWVRTRKQLSALARQLASVDIIAIDLENHALRSYQGFVCLMQLSTAKADYLIDTLRLRKHMHLLQPALADDSILKIMHGCTNDIEWLQRDFGLYVVALFDTAAAARTVGFVSTSLAKLLAHYFAVHVDKSYQLADWRQRPLPAAMQLYARSDSHFLIPLFRRMRKQLSDRGDDALLSAFLRSRKYTTRAYSKRSVKPSSFIRPLLKAAQAAAVEVQPRVAKAYSDVFLLRDRLARRQDESQFYMLPPAVLYAIASALPTDCKAAAAAARGCGEKTEGAMVRHRPWLACIVAICRDAAAADISTLPDFTQTQLEARKSRTVQRSTARRKKERSSARSGGGSGGSGGSDDSASGRAGAGALFENCLLLAPDGTQLALCNRKKAEWYLAEADAEKVSDDPLTVRLKTSTAKAPADDFQLQPKHNRCCVCGSEQLDTLKRVWIVPQQYCRQLPPCSRCEAAKALHGGLKTHCGRLSLHDCVLMCAICAPRMEQHSKAKQAELAKQTGFPLGGCGVKFIVDYELKHARNAASILSSEKKAAALPEARLEEMRQTVKRYTGCEELTDELLQSLMKRNPKQKNAEYRTHAKAVVDQLLAQEDSEQAVQQFVERWRLEFVEYMKPAFLQDGWSVKYPWRSAW